MENDETKLDVFLPKSLRKLMKIFWPMKISNEEIQNRANISTINVQIFRRCWKFIGHILGMDSNKHPKTALTWAPEGRRSRGRPKLKRLGAETHRYKEQLWVSSHGTGQQKLLGPDRATWRRRVSGPIPTKDYCLKLNKS